MPRREEKRTESGDQKRREGVATAGGEEEYHAYPGKPMPWTTGFLTGLFGPYGGGFGFWALLGVLAAVAVWVVVALFSR